MRYAPHVLSLFVPLLVLACENQVTDPEAGSLADNPLFKKCSSPPCGGGGGGSGDGTPADPAIAYLDGGDLKVMNEDGSNQTTVFTSSTTHLGGTPSWSSDGTSLAFRAPGWRLMRVDLKLENGIPVAKDEPTLLTTDEVFQQAWSPTSNTIAYTGDFSLYLKTVSADGGDATIVYEMPPQHCSVRYPTWNPDGDKIAFVEGCDGLDELQILTLADAPTTEAQTLIPEGEFYWISFPAWSRDSTRIVFGGRETSDLDYAVYIVDVKTGLWHELGFRNPYGFQGAPYSWSPDDSKLVVRLDRAVRLVDVSVDADPDSPTYGDPLLPTYGQVIPKRKSKLASGMSPDWRRCDTGPGCGLSP